MTAYQFFWMLARVAGLSAYAALSISLLSGAAIRSGLLGDLGSNRALRAVHEFTAILWIPLGLLHLGPLLLDPTARIVPLDGSSVSRATGRVTSAAFPRSAA